MIFTARQLEEMFKTHGRVVLPYRARLSPLAKDWIRHRGMAIGYGEGLLKARPDCTSCCGSSPRPRANCSQDNSAVADGIRFLWWCDGPCGATKAALLGMAREVSLAELQASSTVDAVRHLAGEVRDGRSGGGILAVASAAEAMVYANRCPSLRAILGTTLQSVDAGVQALAANVLVIEYPGKTLQQVRNMLSRFVRGRRELSEDMKQRLAELARTTD